MIKKSSKLSLLTQRIAKERSFSFVRALIKEFSGVEVYVVGGTVRDALLGRTTKDYDFVVRGVAISKLESFLKKHGSIHAVGRRFGVLKFVPKNNTELEAFDIALPRTEFSIGQSGHYRDFSVQYDSKLPIEDDLSRRDFTINAMALRLNDGELFDPFDGATDIRKKTIRTVGIPKMRFAEDYSRMLRALRFACVLGFSIDNATARAIKKEMRNINNTIASTEVINTRDEGDGVMRVVPHEVIARELVKSFVSDSVRALDLFDEYGVFNEVIPEFIPMKKCAQPKQWHSEGSVWKHTRLALERLTGSSFVKEFGSDQRPDALLIMAVLFHDIGKPPTKKTPKEHGVDRVRFDGHDRVGADMTRVIAERLHLASVPGYSIDVDQLHWLIKHHLILLNSDIATMRYTTIERYFLKDKYLGDTLRKLIFVDSLASIRADKGTTLTGFRALNKRLSEMIPKSKMSLPPSLLNGGEIMELLALQQGPVIGKILEFCREEQLSGRIKTKSQARSIIKKWWKQNSTTV